MITYNKSGNQYRWRVIIKKSTYKLKALNIRLLLSIIPIIFMFVYQTKLEDLK